MERRPRHCVGEMGLPEVDKIFQGSLFTQRRNRNLLLLQTRRRIEKGDPPNILRRCQTLETPQQFLSRPSLDRISDLPDGILEFIISLLTMREAAATSVLSRRWRDLWSRSASCFDFDLPNMTGNDYLDTLMHDDTGLLERERSCFIQWIEQVMQTRLNSDVNELRISFIMGKESALHLDRWIKHAANHGLRELELALEYDSTYAETAYDFPFQSFPRLEYLRLTICNFSYPPNFGGFKSLVSLILIEAFLPTSTVRNILSNCSSLQRLALLNCYFSCESVCNLIFSGPSPRLRYLRLLMMSYAEIPEIEVRDLNITSLEYDCLHTRLSIENTPHLARLVLCTGAPVDIRSHLPRLDTLFVSAFSWAKETVLPKLTVIKNLKQLVFVANSYTTNLLEVIRLLEACPLLLKLEIDMGISGRALTQGPTSISRRPGTIHNNLKEVEIFGFEDHPEKFELARYLLKNAIVLEKMEISLTTKKYNGDAQWTLYEENEEETQTWLKKVNKLNWEEARPTTKLVFCPDN